MPVDKSGVESVKKLYKRGKELVTGIIKNNPIAEAARGGGKVSVTEKQRIKDYHNSPRFKAETEAMKSFKYNNKTKTPPNSGPQKTSVKK